MGTEKQTLGLNCLSNVIYNVKIVFDYQVEPTYLQFVTVLSLAVQWLLFPRENRKYDIFNVPSATFDLQSVTKFCSTS